MAVVSAGATMSLTGVGKSLRNTARWEKWRRRMVGYKYEPNLSALHPKHHQLSGNNDVTFLEVNVDISSPASQLLCIGFLTLPFVWTLSPLFRHYMYMYSISIGCVATSHQGLTSTSMLHIYKGKVKLSF